jgi:transcriptional regulator with XRE-family HTH domain
LRTAGELTQEGLAGRARLDAKGVQAIERGRTNVTMASLVAIAKALRVSLEELFVGVYEP